MAGALGMERRETMKRYSKLAKRAEHGGNAGGEAKFSLEIWGQILKARRGERAGEERGPERRPGVEEENQEGTLDQDPNPNLGW